MRLETDIYVAKVKSHKGSLLQQPRLPLLLSKKPVQNLKDTVLVALIKRLSAKQIVCRDA